VIEGLGEGDPSLSFPRLLISQVGWSIGKHRRAHGAFYRISHWPASARILHSHAHPSRRTANRLGVYVRGRVPGSAGGAGVIGSFEGALNHSTHSSHGTGALLPQYCILQSWIQRGRPNGGTTISRLTIAVSSAPGAVIGFHSEDTTARVQRLRREAE
jgi:hypothetical protein